MLSPRATISITWRSISAGRAWGSTRGRISGGFFAASGGKSHSCVTPATESPRPSANRISVADGNSEQIRTRVAPPYSKLFQPPGPAARGRRKRNHPARRFLPPRAEFRARTSARHSQTCGTRRSRRRDRRSAEDREADAHRIAVPRTHDRACADRRTSETRKGRQPASLRQGAAYFSPRLEIPASCRTQRDAFRDRREYLRGTGRRRRHATRLRRERVPSPRSSPVRKPHSDKVRESAPSPGAGPPPRLASRRAILAPRASPRAGTCD